MTATTMMQLQETYGTGRSQLEWDKSIYPPVLPVLPLPLQFVPSVVVSLGVISLISSLPLFAFLPAIQLSHPTFLYPLCSSYSLSHCAPSPHLTSPHLLGSAYVLSGMCSSPLHYFPPLHACPPPPFF